MDDPKASIKGIYPDTATNVNITNKKDLKNCFDQHRFKVKMESVWDTIIEQDRDGRNRIYDKYYLVIRSAPVSVVPQTITNTIKKIKKEDFEKKNLLPRLDEIIDIIETADKNGIDFALKIEYKKGTDPQELMEKLYKMTSARKTIGVQCVMIDNQNPIRLTPREILLYWIDERISLLTDWIRQKYIKNKFEAIKREAFIIIKKSMKEYVNFVESCGFEDDELVDAVAKKFKLSRPQADYVLNQKFKTISKTNMKKLKKEFTDFNEKAEYYKSMASVKAIKGLIKEQLLEGIELFGTPRNSILYTKKSTKKEVKSNIRYLIYNTDEYYCVNKSADMEKISDTLDPSFKVMLIDDSENYMIFNKAGAVKNVQGIDFTSTINPIEHKLLKNIVSVLPVEGTKKITLVTATGICKSVDISISKGKGSRVIKLKDKDYLADAISTKKSGTLALLVADKMHYTDIKNIPDQKKGAAGNNVFKVIKKPTVSRAYFIPNSATHLFICCESGYFKVIENALAGRDKAKNHIGTNGKDIHSIVIQEGEDVTERQLISNEGIIDMNISVAGKKAVFTTDGKGKDIKIGTSISPPIKTLRFKKTDFYGII